MGKLRFEVFCGESIPRLNPAEYLEAPDAARSPELLTLGQQRSQIKGLSRFSDSLVEVSWAVSMSRHMEDER